VIRPDGHGNVVFDGSFNHTPCSATDPRATAGPLKLHKGYLSTFGTTRCRGEVTLPLRGYDMAAVAAVRSGQDLGATNDLHRRRRHGN
jgi:hypothetical protein